MKKITKPAEKEEATYYSDFSGKCFGEWFPPVELNIDFSYGSKYDGVNLQFHLDDHDVEDVLTLLKSKLSTQTKKTLAVLSTKLDNDYEDNIQMRDWDSCNYISNNKELLERII
jgi:hypothetical protein